MKYVEDKMEGHEHKPTSYGAGVRQAGKILIARASQWGDIESRLGRANELLQRGDPNSVFGAAKILGTVMQKYAALPEALQLKTTVDGKLFAYRNPVIGWLQSNYDLDQFSTLFVDLRTLAARLSVDTIASQNSQMQGLLAYLCGATSKLPNPASPATEDDISELNAYRSARTQGAIVAKTEAPAQGKDVDPPN